MNLMMSLIFPTHVTLSSHEDHKAWASVFCWVKSELGGENSSRLMADGAADITKAAKLIRNVNVMNV